MGEEELCLQHGSTARVAHVFGVVPLPTIVLGVFLPRDFVVISQENKPDTLGEGIFGMEI